MQAVVCVLIVLSFIQTAFLALSWYIFRRMLDDTVREVNIDLKRVEDTSREVNIALKRVLDGQMTSSQTDLELVELKKQFDSLKSALALKSAFVK